jgi:hypothetical protein
MFFAHTGIFIFPPWIQKLSGLKSLSDESPKMLKLRVGDQRAWISRWILEASFFFYPLIISQIGFRQTAHPAGRGAIAPCVGMSK